MLKKNTSFLSDPLCVLLLREKNKVKTKWFRLRKKKKKSEPKEMGKKNSQAHDYQYERKLVLSQGHKKRLTEVR